MKLICEHFEHTRTVFIRLPPRLEEKRALVSLVYDSLLQRTTTYLVPTAMEFKATLARHVC
jgi:hypothetical protein